MKAKKWYAILSCLGVILFGCNQTPVDDDKYLPSPSSFTYYNTVKIDSAASSCGVDSCVINLPWLSDKISTYLKDSTKLKNNIVSDFTIEELTCQNREDSCIVNYFCVNTLLWLNCEGDTVWKDPYYYEMIGDTLVDIGQEEYFINVLETEYKIVEQKEIVRIELGFFPWI